MLKKSITAAALLASVLSSMSSQAYFGQSIVDGAYDTASKAATWVKENPGKTALGVATLTVASCLAYWGYHKSVYNINTPQGLINVCESKNTDLESVSACIIDSKSDDSVASEALAQYLKGKSATKLSFSRQFYNSDYERKSFTIDSHGLKKLAKTLPKLNDLQEISLSGPQINSETLKVVTDVLPESGVTKLYLRETLVPNGEQTLLSKTSNPIEIISIHSATIEINHIWCRDPGLYNYVRDFCEGLKSIKSY